MCPGSLTTPDALGAVGSSMSAGTATGIRPRGLTRGALPTSSTARSPMQPIVGPALASAVGCGCSAPIAGWDGPGSLLRSLIVWFAEQVTAARDARVGRNLCRTLGPRASRRCSSTAKRQTGTGHRAPLGCGGCCGVSGPDTELLTSAFTDELSLLAPWRCAPPHGSSSASVLSATRRERQAPRQHARRTSLVLLEPIGCR